MATSITMETSYSGKQSTRSITNVNPNATAADISTFVKGLNDLTNNTLKTVNRIDKTEIDTDVVYTPVTAAWVEDPGSHLILDGLTVTFDNQETIDEAGLIFYCNEVPINLGSYEVRPSDPAHNRYWLGNYTDNGGVGLSIGAYTEIAPAGKVEVICSGGSVTKNSTTYYYAPFVLTLNYAAKA